MGMFLNSIAPLEAYKLVVTSPYFVDKSALIEELIPTLDMERRYICITRPRRFGKTVIATMIGAFFGKVKEEDSLFDSLVISTATGYVQHLHHHEVFFIDLSRIPEKCSTYESYITRIRDGMKKDLSDRFSDLQIDCTRSVWDILQFVFEETKTKFIFVLDEWDAIFHMPFVSREEHIEYLLFLKNLLKDQVYVELVYMTGVLPIAKYSSGSELNMFAEYDMATKEKFGSYFGFLDCEVDKLYAVYQKNTRNQRITRKDLCLWYDGYHIASGERLYNPRSVVLALSDNQLSDYWTSSGPYDEIFYYIRNNIDDVRDDLVLMAAGERVAAEIGQYTAASLEIRTREQIYSAMVVYGLLTYEDGEVFIPNKELMNQFDELLLTKDSLGYVYRLARKSEQMLKATLEGKVEVMEEILQYAHNTESPILSYNSESELSAVVNLCYLAARDKYHVAREDKAGKGFVDFIFYPERRNLDCIILELKIDSTPTEAIRQIKEKAYALRLKGKLGEISKYTGRILAVGISYSKETKEHHCEIEVLA